MIHAQNNKGVVVLSPIAGSAAATYAPTFDRLDYDYVQLAVLLGSSGTSATDNPSVLTVKEGSITNVSSHTAVPGFTGDTDFTIPAGITTATIGQMYLLNLDCRARQRYLSVAMTLGAATSVSIAGLLGRGKLLPVGATDQNVAVVVNG